MVMSEDIEINGLASSSIAQKIDEWEYGCKQFSLKQRSSKSY